MQDIAFYQAHLDRVSRSFAFCMQQLTPPLRQWTSLAYLVCRILDTVEDTRWSSPTLRDTQYKELALALREPPPAAQVNAWVARFPDSTPEGEKLLLADASLLFADLATLPTAPAHAIRRVAETMGAGMRYYATHHSDAGELRLADLCDVNRYCYFVAGIVGYMLSDLFALSQPHFQAPATLYKDAFHFGLFLQKVNILKDQHADAAEGRFLVPNRQALRASLRDNAMGALNYLTALPLQDDGGYRAFCAWSLFLGTASLPWIEQNFAHRDASKIPRAISMQLWQTLAPVVYDNAALRDLLIPQLAQLPEAEPQHESSADSAWFHALRGEFLRPEDYVALGMA